MKLSDFDFDLPEDLIATRPARPRPSARLLLAEGDRIPAIDATPSASFDDIPSAVAALGTHWVALQSPAFALRHRPIKGWASEFSCLDFHNPNSLIAASASTFHLDLHAPT